MAFTFNGGCQHHIVLGVSADGHSSFGFNPYRSGLDKLTDFVDAGAIDSMRESRLRNSKSEFIHNLGGHAKLYGRAITGKEDFTADGAFKDNGNKDVGVKDDAHKIPSGLF